MSDYTAAEDPLGNRDSYLQSSRGSSLGARVPFLVPSEPMYGERDAAPDTSFDDKYSSAPGSDCTSLSRWREPPIPFIIAIGRHESVVSDCYSSASGKYSALRLLVPPSEFSISSGHEASVDSTRGGQLPALWGHSQPTISLQGSSAAFLTSSGGLAHSSTGDKKVSRTDSLGYQNFMGLVAMFKSNGYKRLTEKEDPFPGRRITGSRNRVVHVLDCVQITYDGTTYLGHFTDLSFSDDANSPFNFKYSISFAVSGIKGDMVGGHICDGVNQDSGILIGRAGSALNKRVNMDIRALQIDVVDRSLATGPSAADVSGKDAVQRTSLIPPANLEKFKNFIKMMKDEGHEVLITSSVRTVAEQHSITKYRYLSRHCIGAAIDINVKLKDGSPNLMNCLHKVNGVEVATPQKVAANIARWNKYGVAKKARACGLQWGGLMYTLGHAWYGDVVHLEIIGDPTALRKLYNDTNNTSIGEPPGAAGAEKGD